MTRDGLYLVERGKVTSAVRNFRFNGHHRDAAKRRVAAPRFAMEAFEMVMPDESGIFTSRSPKFDLLSSASPFIRISFRIEILPNCSGAAYKHSWFAFAINGAILTTTPVEPALWRTWDAPPAMKSWISG